MAKAGRGLTLAALAAVYLVWGSTYFVGKIGLESFPPFVMAGMRFITGGSLLYAGLRLTGSPPPSRVEWTSAVKTGTLMLVGGNGFVVFAQTRVSSSVAAMVVATMPLWMALLSTIAGQRPTRLEWTGLLLGFSGVALLKAGGAIGGSPAHVLLLLTAPICWATGSLWSKRVPMAKGAMGAATQMLTAAPVMLTVGLVRGERFAAMPSGRSILAVVYLALLGSIVAFTAYGFLLRTARPAIATSYAYVNPVVALFLGVAIGGEPAGPSTWVSAAIILAGVVVLSFGRAKPVSAPAEEATISDSPIGEAPPAP